MPNYVDNLIADND